MTERQKWIVIAPGAIILLALAGYLKFNNPETSGAKFLPCGIYKATGYYCSGCGSTRAAHALLNFNLPRAWQQNPALVVSLPFIIFGFGYSFARWLRPGSLSGVKALLDRIPAQIPWIVFWLMILYGVLRNLPMEPFKSLAPG